MRLTIEGHEYDVELDEAGTVLAALVPLELRMSRWGEEYYGSLPRALAPAGPAVDVFERGDLAYWPPGTALCLFFGPTPASLADEPRAASAAHRLGRVTGDLTVLRGLPSGVSARPS